MASRRRFILGSVAVAGALVVGWGLVPPRQRLTGSAPLPVGPGQRAFNGWVKIGTDGRVVVQVPKSEMGQGVHTSLAMLLAEELDADWASVQVEHPPLDALYNNQATVVDGLPFHPDGNGLVKRLAGWMTAKTMREFGLQLTGGSSSVKDLWLPMREAGASARAMLVAAAAAQWGVNAQEVRVEGGVLSHASGRRATFGELATQAGQQPLPRSVVLKTPAQFKLLGQPRPRLESADKVTGRAVFGLDVRLPGMLYATVAMCPTLGGRVKSFDGAVALKMPGVKQVLAVGAHQGSTAGVAVIADAPWRALQALKAVAVQWDEAVPAAQFDGTWTPRRAWPTSARATRPRRSPARPPWSRPSTARRGSRTWRSNPSTARCRWAKARPPCGRPRRCRAWRGARRRRPWAWTARP
jgi:isoquinoline 1-oxidoreductase beta subunit